jgi:transposase
LITLAQKYGWCWGFQDETWWSRFSQPNLSSWCEEQQPLRLVEQTKQKDDPDPKALACYGMLLRWMASEDIALEKMLLRFVDGRPVSAIPIQFLEWVCQEVEQLGHSVLVIIWDNASWHISQIVQAWVHEHNRTVKRSGTGVRLLIRSLPVKSPWLNPIEPKWVHGKRRIVEPNATLSRQNLADRICASFNCQHLDHLIIPENVS